MWNHWHCLVGFIAFLGMLAVPADAQTKSSGAACAACHREIYESYRTTPMARSARQLDGIAGVEQSSRSSFLHKPSGFRYQVSIKDSAYTFGFANPSTGTSGSKRLSYAVGSGTRAISYLIANDGFLFEAPVAYYTRSEAWGLAPGYDRYDYPFLTRPIAPGCLACHASGVQIDSGTLNRYRSPAFLEGGVSCERCHGNGERHIAKMKSGNLTGGLEMLNPAKLPAPNRDSICAQCHLSGDVRVMRPGADWQTFQPGARLSDSQTVFVRSGKTAGVTVTGHMESLAASACKRASGDRLWCGSCHDPHKLPGRTETASWFRSKCLSCHAEKGCSETKQARAKANDNCIGCHMPAGPATDAEHVVLTDHSIPRRPRTATRARDGAADELLAFYGSPAVRDVALAYAYAALGESGAASRVKARSLLERAAVDSPKDVEVLVSLAEIYRNADQGEAARPLYTRALELDSGQLTALSGLGAVTMERGEYAQAIRLWTAALTKNSGLELVRLNLALAQWKTGDRAGSEANLRKALEINPAFAPARKALAQLGLPPQK
jgi:predicted CXXCH cytochrome family protein